MLRLASVSSRRVATSGQMRVQNYEEKGKRQNILRKICKYRNKFVSLQGQNMSFGYPGRIPRGVRLYRYCPILKAVIRQLFFIFFSEFSGRGHLAEMHIYAVLRGGRFLENGGLGAGNAYLCSFRMHKYTESAGAACMFFCLRRYMNNHEWTCARLCRLLPQGRKNGS